MKKVTKIKNIAICLVLFIYLCIEAILSDAPFLFEFPDIIIMIMQKPSDSSVLYLALSIIRNLCIGVIGAVLYDFIMIQIPKYANITRHKRQLKVIANKLEEIITIYLLTNKLNTNFSNLGTDDFKNSRLCLTNETIYYKELDGDSCFKAQIFNKYKENVKEVLLLINQILNNKYPLIQKYEDILYEIVSNDFIILIDEKNNADYHSDKYPLQPSLANVFRFKPNQIIQLYDVYLAIVNTVGKDYYSPVYQITDKITYLNNFCDEIIVRRDLLTDVNYNYSFIEDIRDCINYFRQFSTEETREKCSDFFYYLNGGIKTVASIYELNIKNNNFQFSYVLQSWIDLLEYCYKSLDVIKVFNKIDAKMNLLLSINLFKQYLGKYSEDDKSDFQEFFNTYKECFNERQRFDYYVLMNDKDNAESIYKKSTHGFKKDIEDSMFWDNYLSLSGCEM